MDKQAMKKIEIVDVVVHELKSFRDCTDEYFTNCNIDFILSESFTFNVFDEEYVIDRIKMSCPSDEIDLEYAQADKKYSCFPVSKIFIHKVMDRVVQEEKNGVLEGWSFADELLEILQG